MAKIRHRTFEIYDFLLEASEALATKSARQNTYAIDPSQWEFQQLDAALRPSGVVHISFKPHADDDSKLTKISKTELGRDLSGDLADLAELLSNNSRVLLDFEGVLEYAADAVIKLGEFDSKLRNKGSRIVLCNLEPAVRESFFQPVSTKARL